jgi:hypothetical protein
MTAGRRARRVGMAADHRAAQNDSAAAIPAVASDSAPCPLLRSILSMKTFVKALMVLGMVGMIGLAFAQEKKGGKKKGNNPAAGLLKKVDGLGDLTAEQKEKIAKIKEEHEPKLAAAAKKVNDALTPDQRRARQEAQKAARQAGKKGKEAQAEIAAAMKLTDEQQKAYDAAPFALPCPASSATIRRPRSA